MINTVGGVGKLWLQPLEGGDWRQLTDFKSEGIWAYGWSKDGKYLAVARGSQSQDVILISLPK